ncbi:MAG: hypothetical protein HQL24_09680, partial [Candidatus Omnitrophica bacterium]|nr:hypothetical protein [Candidatus Omnitrophota bacterium]
MTSNNENNPEVQSEGLEALMLASKMANDANEQAKTFQKVADCSAPVVDGVVDQNIVMSGPSFQSKFKLWIRTVALIVICTFLPEQVSWAFSYNPLVLWKNKAAVKDQYLGYGTTATPVDAESLNNDELASLRVSESVRHFLDQVKNKPSNARVQLELPNPHVAKLSKENQYHILINTGKRFNDANIQEITSWLKKPAIHPLNCGVYALKDLLAAYDIKFSLEEVSVMSLLVDLMNDIVRPGDPKLKTSLYSINKIVSAYGLDLKAAKLAPHQLLKLKTPFLASFENEHFVTVTKITDSEVQYSDVGQKSIASYQDFVSEATGFVLAPDPKGRTDISFEYVPDAMQAFVWGSVWINRSKELKKVFVSGWSLAFSIVLDIAGAFIPGVGVAGAAFSTAASSFTSATVTVFCMNNPDACSHGWGMVLAVALTAALMVLGHQLAKPDAVLQITKQIATLEKLLKTLKDSTKTIKDVTKLAKLLKQIKQIETILKQLKMLLAIAKAAKAAGKGAEAVKAAARAGELMKQAVNIAKAAAIAAKAAGAIADSVKIMAICTQMMAAIKEIDALIKFSAMSTLGQIGKVSLDCVLDFAKGVVEGWAIYKISNWLMEILPKNMDEQIKQQMASLIAGVVVQTGELAGSEGLGEAIQAIFPEWSSTDGTVANSLVTNLTGKNPVDAKKPTTDVIDAALTDYSSLTGTPNPSNSSEVIVPSGDIVPAKTPAVDGPSANGPPSAVVAPAQEPPPPPPTFFGTSIKIPTFLLNAGAFISIGLKPVLDLIYTCSSGVRKILDIIENYTGKGDGFIGVLGRAGAILVKAFDTSMKANNFGRKMFAMIVRILVAKLNGNAKGDSLLSEAIGAIAESAYALSSQYNAEKKIVESEKIYLKDSKDNLVKDRKGNYVEDVGREKKEKEAAEERMGKKYGAEFIVDLGRALISWGLAAHYDAIERANVEGSRDPTKQTPQDRDKVNQLRMAFILSGSVFDALMIGGADLLTKKDNIGGDGEVHNEKTLEQKKQASIQGKQAALDTLDQALALNANGDVKGAELKRQEAESQHQLPDEEFAKESALQDSLKSGSPEAGGKESGGGLSRYADIVFGPLKNIFVSNILAVDNAGRYITGDTDPRLDNSGNLPEDSMQQRANALANYFDTINTLTSMGGWTYARSRQLYQQYDQIEKSAREENDKLPASQRKSEETLKRDIAYEKGILYFDYMDPEKNYIYNKEDMLNQSMGSILYNPMTNPGIQGWGHVVGAIGILSKDSSSDFIKGVGANIKNIWEAAGLEASWTARTPIAVLKAELRDKLAKAVNSNDMDQVEQINAEIKKIDDAIASGKATDNGILVTDQHEGLAFSLANSPSSKKGVVLDPGVAIRGDVNIFSWNPKVVSGLQGVFYHDSFVEVSPKLLGKSTVVINPAFTKALAALYTNPNSKKAMDALKKTPATITEAEGEVVFNRDNNLKEGTTVWDFSRLPESFRIGKLGMTGELMNLTPSDGSRPVYLARAKGPDENDLLLSDKKAGQVKFDGTSKIDGAFLGADYLQNESVRNDVEVRLGAFTTLGGRHVNVSLSRDAELTTRKLGQDEGASNTWKIAR